MADGEFMDNVAYDLEPSEVAKIVNHYGLTFDAGTMPVALLAWHPIYDRPYKVLTDRELAVTAWASHLDRSQPFSAATLG